MAEERQGQTAQDRHWGTLSCYRHSPAASALHEKKGCFGGKKIIREEGSMRNKN